MDCIHEQILMEAGRKLLPSGVGHDVQSMARTCPPGMIFAPGRGET
jgi:hypothetical protein